ncbi:hypothetical protein KCP73_21785 [Salmonella enterica subsp. enterica]|nr:hypothetical protein KCP73_21785 [Salmonella enterica subsp. enterica]
MIKQNVRTCASRRTATATVTTSREEISAGNRCLKSSETSEVSFSEFTAEKCWRELKRASGGSQHAAPVNQICRQSARVND